MEVWERMCQGRYVGKSADRRIVGEVDQVYRRHVRRIPLATAVVNFCTKSLVGTTVRSSFILV